MPSSWSNEFWRLIGVLFFCLLLGLLTGYVMELLLVGLAAGVGWYQYNLYRLQKWLESPKRDNVPPETGVWGDLYYRVLKLRANSLSRKRRLRELLSQFRASAEALPDGAIALGDNWEIRWFNEAAKRLLDLHPGKDIGSPIVNLFRNPAFARYLDREDFTQPLSINVPGGPETRLSIRVIPYGVGQWLMLAQDVTERHRLERIRSDFVANVSHELRTPLTVLSGYIENLQHDEDVGRVDKLSHPLSRMQQQTSRMMNIVEDLLLLAKLEANQSGQRLDNAVDVTGMIRQLADEADSARPEGHADIQLDIRSDAGLLGDPAQLRGAFTNLVMNAVNYTPVDGEIRIAWYVDPAGRPCFEVRDTGDGIAPEHIPRLTERFYRVDAGRSRQSGGTGLGLAIVKHALQNHQAELIIESRLGQGSMFRCRFPASRLDEGAKQLELSAAKSSA
jgi:two-component system phosphate regulon sensor histidine kinase PhoR